MDKYKSCAEHVWPRHFLAGSNGSVGSIEVSQCNNCLAVKVEFDTYVQEEAGAWVRKTDTKFVEPKFE